MELNALATGIAIGAVAVACRAVGAQPAPQVTNVTALAGISSAAIGATVKGSPDPVTVWLFWGEEDGGTNCLAWDETTNRVYQVPGDVTFRITRLLPGTTYYFTFAARNGGGITWSETCTFKTETLQRIKQQTGTVVEIR